MIKSIQASSHKFIFIGIFFLVLVFSSGIYAKDSLNVISKCDDEYEMSCNIYSSVGNNVKKVLEKVKSPVISKVNDNFFHVKTSCGSPCQIHFFINEYGEDFTDEYIVLNKKDYCLIESDSEKKVVYARSLFGGEKKVLINLKEQEYKVLPSKLNYYSDFNEMSFFDENNNLHLIANDYGKILVNKVLKNPCKSK
ncbi:hypothetical protein MMO38_10535 [Acinetobacter sp. NIPH 1852]|uniref:hypothetical protein n=1 Tax=Acinetobacter sp. NIPH 1852 TaxID=2923428 RepID=UPI001F4A527B|nr:hypothetical protein [Acinetobacter sp. NIPH 1852]MCH7308567.1 hypothetical protein [Acinetobacter sp. NIPH 1852]